MLSVPLTPKQQFAADVASTAARVARIEAAISNRVEGKRRELQGALDETAGRLERIEMALASKGQTGDDLTKSLLAVLERMEGIEGQMQRLTPTARGAH